MTSSDSKLQQIQTHFLTLSQAASALNTASDEFTKVVSILDEAIKKLNVGLTVWVTFLKWSTDGEHDLDEEQIGYCKLNGRWGIALRRIWGDPAADIFKEDGPWHFNEGPREMRLRGVDKIPEVIENLGKTALKTTRDIEEKTKETRDLASVIEQLAGKKVVAPPPPPPPPGKPLAASAKVIVVAPPNATPQKAPVPPPPPPAPLPRTQKDAPLSSLLEAKDEGSK